MSSSEFSALNGGLEALGLIYRVDLLRLQDVQDEAFRARIERDRKIFWEPRTRSAQAAEPGAVELKEFQIRRLRASVPRNKN